MVWGKRTVVMLKEFDPITFPAEQKVAFEG